MEENTPKLPDTEIILYQTEDNDTRIDVRLWNETVWLNQQQMAELFQTSIPNISMHIKNVYDEGELEKLPTVKDFLTVQKEGQREVSRNIEYYNLDVIISVGYRVKSKRGTQFRIWATKRLKEYIIKGFTMDDERLKNPPTKDSPVPDYFDEMLARIRDIRASEKRMYLRVREIFSMAADYEPVDSETTKFFSIIQNKLHYAATGMTAAELIQTRVDAEQPNMGLTTWKGSEVRKLDVTIAKNYLNENEIDELNGIVVMWLDFAEDQARRRKQVFMKDWEQRLDDFLKFNERDVLVGAGSVSKEEADEAARLEYEKFEVRRRKYKESLGEEDYLKQLEETAKELPVKDRRGTVKNDDSSSENSM